MILPTGDNSDQKVRIKIKQVLCLSISLSTTYSQIHPALQQIPIHSILNFACDWLTLDRDISFGRLTSPNVWRYIPIES